MVIRLLSCKDELTFWTVLVLLQIHLKANFSETWQIKKVFKKNDRFSVVNLSIKNQGIADSCHIHKITTSTEILGGKNYRRYCLESTEEYVWSVKSVSESVQVDLLNAYTASNVPILLKLWSQKQRQKTLLKMKID